VHFESLELTPVRHRGIGIEAHSFFEGAIGFEIPEIMEQAKPLIEIGLRRFGARRDGEVGIADALHQRGRR
jgi:hypothetical protein